MHPFDVYLELAEVIGALSIFRTEEFEGKCELPEFDYRSPAQGFLRGIEIIRDLIPSVWNDFVDEVLFKVDADEPAIMSVDFSKEWLGSEWRLYFGVEKPDGVELDESELFSDLKEHCKIAPRRSVGKIVAQATDGFSLQVLPRIPDILPNKDTRIYFEIDFSSMPDLIDPLRRFQILSYRWVRARSKHDSLNIYLNAVRRPYAQRTGQTTK